MTSIAEQALREGQLDEALAAVQDAVRGQPAKAEHRVSLFQLLAVAGEWAKALRQLNVLSDLDPKMELLAATYRQLIACEGVRGAVFEGKRAPLCLGDPPDWYARLVEALRLDGAGQHAAAKELRDEAFAAAEPTAGRHGDDSFAWLADADERLGPILEAIVGGRYFWIPFARVRRIELDEPEDLRDLVWLPARLTWANLGEAVAFIPVRYWGSERDPIRAAARSPHRMAPARHGQLVRFRSADAGDGSGGIPAARQSRDRARDDLGPSGDRRCLSSCPRRSAALAARSPHRRAGRHRAPAGQDRARLLALLTDDEKKAFERLCDSDRRWLRPPSARDLEPFARLDQDTRELLERVVGLEQRRVFELRQHHVISVERLRECVLRDLSWLFNTASLECSELLDETPGTAAYPRLDEFPAAAASVINFGIPALAGKLGSGLDLEALERRVQAAIHNFEPRLRRDSVRVRAVLEAERMQQNTLTFEIEAELWGETAAPQVAAPHDHRSRRRQRHRLREGGLMDRRFLRYYEDELQHLRDVGGEFAKTHSGIAAKLGLDAFACSIPWRLLEASLFWRRACN